MDRLREVLDQVQRDYDKLKEEYEHLAVLLGHQNKKQKIHYISSMKDQLRALMDENEKLRVLAASVSKHSSK